MGRCACRDEPAIDASSRHVVTLVHGTYARHAKWMRDGQPLPDALAGLEGLVLRRFCWRGRNRHADRVKAGGELKTELTDLAAKYPDAEHHVIAHSHGGNAALYAVGGGDGLPGVSVITLGTPFLAMTARPVSRWFLAIALLGTVIMVDNLRVWTFGQHEDESSPIAWLWLLYYGAFGLSGTIAILAIAISAFLFRRTATAGWWDLLRGKPVDAESARVTSPPLSDGRLFVVRAQGDEAAALLGAGQLASWVLKKALSLTRVLLWLVPAAVIASALVEEGTPGLTVVGWLFVAPLVAVSVLVFLLAFAYLPFGVDMLFWTLHAAVTSGPSPTGYTSGFQAGGGDGEELAHSVYHDPEVIDLVVRRIGSPAPTSGQ